MPVERDIIVAASDLLATGVDEFYGFWIAKQIRDLRGARLLTGHGTLYRALERLEKQGYLESRWEDPEIAANENRPRRRLCRLTALGANTGQKLLSEMSGSNVPLRPAWANRV